MKNLPVQAFRIVPRAETRDRIEAEREWPVAPLFGHDLICANRSKIARHIMARVGANKNSTINFVNAHCINMESRDAEYRDALRDSDLLLPDGVGLEIAGQMCGTMLGENLNGTDLFPEICREASDDGIGIFLLGGLPDVAQGAAEWATQNYPALRIAGARSGFFKADDEEVLIEQINASHAGILLVGFGVPLQEKWIARNRNRLTVPVVMGVGGLFDYYSGRIPRAPHIIRAFKCEWMWRLSMEPRRMAGRYILGNALFLVHAAYEAICKKGINHKANFIAKRALDIILASLALIALFPIIIATAFAVWLEDRGPIFFNQTRIGEAGKPFNMLKFRSMYIDAEARRRTLLDQSDRSGASFKMRKDPRITSTGSLIRRFSIDELPQLLNVLGGSMSLVGPRPALPSEVVTYEGAHWERLMGKPGITCTWQVRGRADIPFQRQAIMDRAYLKKCNLWVDIKLLLSTPRAVLSGRGAY